MPKCTSSVCAEVTAHLCLTNRLGAGKSVTTIEDVLGYEPGTFGNKFEIKSTAKKGRSKRIWNGLNEIFSFPS